MCENPINSSDTSRDSVDEISHQFDLLRAKLEGESTVPGDPRDMSAKLEAPQPLDFSPERHLGNISAGSIDDIVVRVMDLI